MNTDLKAFLLHLFEIHIDRCLVINVNVIHRYIEYIQKYGNRTKSEIRQTIRQLWLDNLIVDYEKVSDNVYIIYK